MEPPPNVMRAERLRKGQVSTRGMRTGAKTATKDQERDYLERFERLAQDPSPLVPRWEGGGRDPFAAMRSQLAKVQARRGSTFWLKWYGRGRKMRSAYAHTLLILRGGRIPSFASIRLRGRDVKFILRGNGIRDKLVAVQNADDPDARLLGFVDVARRKRLVLVSLPDDFFAIPPGGPLPAGALERILREADVPAEAHGAEARCPHAAQRPVVEHELSALGVRVSLCRACGKRLPHGVTPAMEGYVLPPGGRFEDTRRVRGSERTVHPGSFREDFERMVERASDAARQKSQAFEDVHDDDLLDWAEESFQAGLDARPDGFLLIRDDLWLGNFDEAAERYGENDRERQALRSAFKRRVPRVRASEATLNRLLEEIWATDARPILEEASGGRLGAADLAPLEALRPSEALAALERLLGAEDRFSAFPRLLDLPPALQLAHDLFKSHRTGDTSRFQRRLAEGVRDAATKPLALALARAFGQGAGVEWHYAPHEKDQALFFEPAARALAMATPENYTESLGRLAEALNLPPPSVRS